MKHDNSFGFLTMKYERERHRNFLFLVSIVSFFKYTFLDRMIKILTVGAGIAASFSIKYGKIGKMFE